MAVLVMQTHIDDVTGVLTYEDLRGVILARTSSSGAAISGVADRAPERISQLVYVDAFVPDDGQAVFDLIAPQGFGWLLPRYALSHEVAPRPRITSPHELAPVLLELAAV